jgi:hypothetical protein
VWNDEVEKIFSLYEDTIVGKTVSVVDYVKRINRVLHDDDLAYDAFPGAKEMI